MKLFGIGLDTVGETMRVFANPDFQRHFNLAIQTLANGGERAARIEAKLDFIMRSMGHSNTVDEINVTITNAFRASAASLVVDGRPDAGTGRYTVEGTVVDPGTTLTPGTNTGIVPGPSGGSFQATAAPNGPLTP
jgi:hypothetical protein